MGFKNNMSQFPKAVSEIFFWKQKFQSVNFRKLASHISLQTIAVSLAGSTGYAADLVRTMTNKQPEKVFFAKKAKKFYLKGNFRYRICAEKLSFTF